MSGDPLRDGVALHGAGRLAEARRCYEQVLALQPSHPDALHLLGVLDFQTGNADAAVERIRRAIRINGKVAMYHANLAAALAASGRESDARRAWRRALELDPDDLQALTGLAAHEARAGHKREAAALYGRAVALAPNDLRLVNNYGIALLEADSVGEAIAVLERAAASAPESGHARYNLGNALMAAERRAEARACYEAAARSLPDFADVWAALGRLDVQESDFEGALRCFQKALELAPESPGTLANAGNSLMRLGRLDEAEASFRAALAIEGDHPESLSKLAVMERVQADDPTVARMTALAATDTLEPRERATLCFALGRIFDRAGQADAAFAHFAEANRIAARVQTADGAPDGAATLESYADAAVAAFTPELMERLRAQGIGHESDRPIFVLGMPRSGTTLVEQILASHPDVYGAGELDALSDVANALGDALGAGYPGCLETLTAASARRAAEDYLARLPAAAATARRVVDKMPGNFAEIGLIALILPRARIIHCRRDPLDVGFSCFTQNFRDAMAWTTDLERIARYCKAYQRLMAHWRALPGIEMCDVDYEAMIAEPERESRRIVAYCGLEWDPRCLDFHKTERVVNTASLLQVRRPIYTSAVGRWRRYAAHLGPLIDALNREG